MRSGLKIAVGGKGGVGKSTASAILAQLFARDGFDVLAIDADPNPNLALALGIPAAKQPQPLIQMKELIHERTGARPGAVGEYFTMNPEVADLPDRFCYRLDGVKLLVLGAIENAGQGCACPESAFLKALLMHTILHRRELILVDLAAGLEFLGRACVQGIDALVVVVEPGARSIATAHSLIRMAGEIGITRIGIFINKTGDDGQRDTIAAQFEDIPILGAFRHEPSLQSADLNSLPAIEACGELTDELARVKHELISLISKDCVPG